MVKKTMTALLMMLLLMTLLSTSTVYAEPVPTDEDSALTLAGDYYQVLEAWKNENFPDSSAYETIIAPSAFASLVLNDLSSSQGYPHPTYAWDDATEVSFDVTVPNTGLYQVALDFFSLSDNYLDLELSILINGELQYLEASQIILYKHWQQQSEFSLDRYGNDFYGSQTQIQTWIHQDFQDPMGLFVEPLAFLLDEGVNTITLKRIKGELLLGDITVTGLKTLPTYADYIGPHTVTATELLITTEAEIPTFKNASSIQPGVSRTVDVTPFSVRYLKLNSLSGATFNSERESVTYELDVPETGYYHLTFKVMQGGQANGVIYRTLRINGKVPFFEAYSIGIEYDTAWQNFTIGDETPYLFYLEQGLNEISLSVDLSPYREPYYAINEVLDFVNALSLKIKKLTGNQLDEDRDWEITDFLPEIVSDLNDCATILQANQAYLGQLSQTLKLSEAESSLKIAIRNLRFLADDPNDIPKNMTLLSTSSSSIASTLGNTLALLLNSPLDIDKFYLHTEVELDKPNANFFVRAWVSVKRFVLSFFDKRFTDQAEADELVVWINRSKQYVDLMQKMIDDSFTEETGIVVKASLMAAEGKLILANSAGTNPDVALGVSSWLPYDLGIRGAILDLTQFKDDPEFADVLGYYQEESLIPMIYDEGLYGLPDTENFYVLFYRSDILEALEIPVPDTWDEVTEIMPILKRYGMNFYLPLSSSSSLKSFDSTLPFLFQYGSEIYSEDAFTVTLANTASVSALEMMTELYTIYSMDTTVSSFYNDFRLGLSPIGVGDFGMYITLLNAAPDIQGLWKIALLPGVVQDDLSINRSATGAQTANMIFKNTEKPEASWAFLKWWSSTEIQTTFSNLLLSTFGKEYLWNSANTLAFQNLNMNSDDLSIVLEQWTHLRELPKVPGSYQVELEISNLWNSVVIDRKNLRVLLNDGIIKMNKEIKKKMSEFGYVDKQGNILNPYILADVALIQSWKSGDQDD